MTLVGTGAEVHTAIAAQALLSGQGIGARVVSMPSWELFAAQDDSYRDEVLPPTLPRVSVEAGVSMGWERWVDRAVAIDRFGASAPGDLVLEKLGITGEHVAQVAKDLLWRRTRRAVRGWRSARRVAGWSGAGLAQVDGVPLARRWRCAAGSVGTEGVSSGRRCGRRSASALTWERVARPRVEIRVRRRWRSQAVIATGVRSSSQLGSSSRVFVVGGR